MSELIKKAVQLLRDSKATLEFCYIQHDNFIELGGSEQAWLKLPPSSVSTDIRILII